MRIEVRLADKNDIEKLHEIVTEMDKCDIALRGERFHESLDSGLSCYLMASYEDKAVGFINLWLIPDIVDGNFIGVILDCYVLGEYRSRGVGKLLMEAAMDFGRGRGVNKYFSWVDPSNEPAISLLKKYGFGTGSMMLEKKE